MKPHSVSNLDHGRKAWVFVEYKTAPINSILCTGFRIDLSQFARIPRVSNVDSVVMDNSVDSVMHG